MGRLGPGVPASLFSGESIKLQRVPMDLNLPAPLEGQLLVSATLAKRQAPSAPLRHRLVHRDQLGNRNKLVALAEKAIKNFGHGGYRGAVDVVRQNNRARTRTGYDLPLNTGGVSIFPI